MFTIFASCKPFKDEDGIHQRNAIRSWARLTPKCDILLFNNTPGTAEIAAEVGARHVPDIERNEAGRPMLDFMFRNAREISRFDWLCFTNADILIFDDWIEALARTQKVLSHFLLCGRRRAAEVSQEIDFTDVNWKNRFQNIAPTPGQFGLDAFVFHRTMFENFPPMVTGHFFYDSWPVYDCRRVGIPVVEAQTATLVHQDHARAPWDIHHLSPGDQRNVDVAGGLDKMFGVCDATLQLTPSGLHSPSLTLNNLRRMLDTLPVLHPWLKPFAWPVKKAIMYSRSLRHKFGLRLAPY